MHLVFGPQKWALEESGILAGGGEVEVPLPQNSSALTLGTDLPFPPFPDLLSLLRSSKPYWLVCNGYPACWVLSMFSHGEGAVPFLWNTLPPNWWWNSSDLSRVTPAPRASVSAEMEYLCSHMNYTNTGNVVFFFYWLVIKWYKFQVCLIENQHMCSLCPETPAMLVTDPTSCS